MTTASPTQSSAVPSPTAATTSPSLRWWPAAVLLAVMAFLSTITSFVEPSFPVFMTKFFGPAIATVLLIVWWLGFSRAGMREKLLVIGGVLLIGVISVLCLHFSLKAMWVIMNVVPTAGAAFALAMIVSSRWSSSLRMPLVFALTAAAFGYWETIQTEGVTGEFKAQYRWRWEPTSEDQYLISRGKQDRSLPKPSEGETLTSGESGSLHAEWPGFRGPNRDGCVPGIVLTEKWDTQPPREMWRKLVGPGWSSFAVAGSRLFTQEQRGKSEAVVCMDAKTGADVWAYEYPDRFWEPVAGAGPRATPTLADGGLFAYGAEGMLVRLNPLTGALVWKQDIKMRTELKPPMWGFSSSPLVTHGMAIVHAGEVKNKGMVLAFDVATGEPKWSIPSGDHSYSSAELATFDGVTGILMLTNLGLQFLSPETGKEIWDYKWKFENYRCLQPLVLDHAVLVATGMGTGTRRVDVSHKDSMWGFHDDWTSTDMKCDFNDFVEHKGMLYGFDNEIFGCIDLATGKRQWKKGRYGKGQVLLLPDADQLLVLSEQGDIVLLRATPKKWEELAQCKGIQGKTWNHPVLVGNHLYIRNAEEAACYEMPTVVPASKDKPTVSE